MTGESALGVTAALGSAASWAVGAFLFKRLGEVLSPLAMTLLKGLWSLLFLGLVLALLGGEAITAQSLGLLALSGLLGIALGDSLFFMALQGLGPQPLLVLAVLGQVLTVVLAVLCLGESYPWSAWVGVLFVLVGVAVVLHGTLAGEKQPTRTRGVILGLLAVACMSTSNIIAKLGLAGASDTLQATFVRMLAGTLGIFCYGLARQQLPAWVTPFRNPRLLLFFVLSVVVVTFGGFWLGMVAFKYTSVGVASILTSLEPVFALVLAAVFLRERLTWRAVAGTLAALLGVAFLYEPEVGGLLRALFAHAE